MPMTANWWPTMANARVQNFGEFVFERSSSLTSASSAAIRVSMADVFAGIGGSVSMAPSWTASIGRYFTRARSARYRLNFRVTRAAPDPKHMSHHHAHDVTGDRGALLPHP